MTRLRVPKGQVFLKKEEKILRTLKDLDANHSDSDFTAVSEDMKYTFGGQDARTTRVWWFVFVPHNIGKGCILKFKELYPDDWQKIVARYEAHQRLTPKGKSHPMPPPAKYLLNISRKHRTVHAQGENLSSLAKESDDEV